MYAIGYLIVGLSWWCSCGWIWRDVVELLGEVSREISYIGGDLVENYVRDIYRDEWRLVNWYFDRVILE